ncbi:MAG: pitrilysin family protein [Myxococcota bacterium]
MSTQQDGQPADDGVGEPEVVHHPSGLRIAVRPMPDSPVASVHLWFDAGAVDETPEVAGAAHFVEHMLFKGTSRRAVGEAAAAIEAAGGDLNAWTSWDETCFHATLEAGEVREALDVVFDMTSASVLDADELEREKQVVLEEIRGYEDDPDSVASDRIQALVFPEHPYGRPVIGFPSTVSSLTREAVERFWRSNYHPGRAVLAVAGPIHADEVVAMAEPLLARWAAGTSRSAIPQASVNGGVHLERMDREFGSVVVHFGWPGPPLGHPDRPALDVLTSALGAGAASRLAVKLDLEAGAASHVWADAMAWVGGGIVGAGFLCGETEEAVRLSVELFAETAREGVPASLVGRARDSLLADLLFATETAEGVAADLAWSVARTGNPRYDVEYAAQIAAVTPADVRRVARQWLDLDQMRLVVIDRGVKVRKLEALVAQARKPPVRRPPSGKPETFTVAGAKVAVLPDKGKIAAVEVVAVGGQLLDVPRFAGASDAWSRMVLRGAGPYDATSFAERSDGLALQIDAAAGRSTARVSASFPASDAEAALTLLGDVLLDPHFDEQDWDNVREELLDDQAALTDRPATLASDLLWRALWPDHPWRLAPLGTPATVQRINVRTLSRRHEAQITADNLVLAVAGGVDPDRVARILEPVLEGLPKAAALPARPPSSPPLDVAVGKRAGNEQAIVLCGVRGVRIGHPDRTSLTVATNLLDSQSGRLFLKLREERGLAYGVWARSDTGYDGGVFSAGLATDPARVDEAMGALVDELAALADKGPTAEELARTTRMLGGLAAMRQQRVSGRASDLAWSTRFDLPYGLPALKERLAAVTPASVKSALRKLGVGRPARVIVRPRK